MKQLQDNPKTEQYFYGIYFQKKWKKYLKFFGKDLDILFGDDYNKKIRLSVGLDHLLNNKLNDAYHEIKHFEQLCVTDEEREIYNRLIKHCYNKQEMAKVKVGDWVKKSSGGYYKVVYRTSEYAVIKQGFDSKLNYVKQSKRIDYYQIQFTDLKTYQLVEKKELKIMNRFFFGQ